MQEKQLKTIQNKIASWIKEIESAFIDELFSKIGRFKNAALQTHARFIK